MDWENQPGLFRTYEGAERIELPLLERDPEAVHIDLYVREKNLTCPFDLKHIGAFLELSLALSAWKSLPGAAPSERWPLRINPSSGNLHPTEAHLLLPETGAIPSGVYHYDSYAHALERRAKIPRDLWTRITDHFGVDGFFVGLSSIFWREAWKYGERAYRYCQLDLGHALACISFSGNLQGWRVAFLKGVSDEGIEKILGFDRTEFPRYEEENAELLCYVCSSRAADIPERLPDRILERFSELPVAGKPNRLSREPFNWKRIYRTAELARRGDPDEKAAFSGSLPFRDTDRSPFSAAQIIRRRRSALDFDIRGPLTAEQFLGALDKTLPRKGCAPFDAGLMHPEVHLLIFVHNVRELSPGLYLFLRDESAFEGIRARSGGDFYWRRMDERLPLYLLERGDFRERAARVSCGQEIAGTSAFSLGMIARFGEVIREHPFRYRNLHWEAGMIGQVLYLEAEARAARGTGMGCFFDDPVHQLMGIADDSYRSLYHFTAGQPIEDRRLLSEAPYSHRKLS
jgi:SagB-type dehydrogenase family enzyme